MLTKYEELRLLRVFSGCGCYKWRMWEFAKHAVLSGTALDEAIRRAKAKYGF